jgi:GNAT superfamily N-acetyltransferase
MTYEEARISTAVAPVEVVPARPEHLESLVDCHLAALSQDFVPSLGRRFVRLHDRFYMDAEDGAVLVTLDPASGRVSGFILGGSPAVRTRFVRRYAPFVLGTILCRSLLNARVRDHAIDMALDTIRPGLIRFGLARPQAGEAPPEPVGTWGTSIALATHPDFRSDGAGRALALLEAMHQACARLGFRVTRAMTPSTNLTSHLMHTRLGWKVIGTAKGHYWYRREVVR